MTRSLMLCAALATPLLLGACSMMGDTASPSNVSRDSAGAGAISGTTSTPGGATVGMPSPKNPS